MARIVRSEHKRSFIIDQSSKASLSLMILKVQDIKEKASQIMLLCTLSHIHALELNYNMYDRHRDASKNLKKPNPFFKKVKIRIRRKIHIEVIVVSKP